MSFPVKVLVFSSIETKKFTISTESKLLFGPKISKFLSAEISSFFFNCLFISEIDFFIISIALILKIYNYISIHI